MHDDEKGPVRPRSSTEADRRESVSPPMPYSSSLPDHEGGSRERPFLDPPDEGGRGRVSRSLAFFDPMPLLSGPVLFGLTGAACGVMFPMLLWHDRTSDAVIPYNTVPIAALGTLWGVATGNLAMRLRLRFPRLIAWVEVAGTALLVGLVCGIGGWIVGDKRDANPPPTMLWSLLTGLGVGAGVGVARLLLERRRSARSGGALQEERITSDAE